MLKKVTDHRCWDKLLPLVHFAYREVPQEVTGFSPFELIYSKDVRELLDILKEEWIPTEDIVNILLPMSLPLIKV